MFTTADRRLLIPFHVILPVKDLLHERYHGEGTDEDETEGATPQQVSTSRWIRVAHSRHPAISKDNKISKNICLKVPNNHACTLLIILRVDAPFSKTRCGSLRFRVRFPAAFPCTSVNNYYVAYVL